MKKVYLLPNLITTASLFCGMLAITQIFQDRLVEAAWLILAAAILDAFDGKIARLTRTESAFGVNYDSLADLVSFGVAPALVLYIWQLQGTRYGWIVALVFAVCMMLRLARFNTLLDEVDEFPFTREFFVGVPAPAAAMSAGLPLYATLHFGSGWWSAPPLVAGWALVVAALMVSRLPTLSFKSVRVSPHYIAPLLVLVAIVAAVLITVPFLGLGIVALVYLCSIPYTVHRHHWLTEHPEAWGVPVRERIAIARAARSARRLGLRSPLRHRVAGRERRRPRRAPVR